MTDKVPESAANEPDPQSPPATGMLAAKKFLLITGAVIVLAVLNILAAWLSVKMLSWGTSKLNSWHSSCGLTFWILVFGYSIAGVIIYFIATKIIDDIRKRENIDIFCLSIVFGKVLTPFFLYFVGFAFLCSEINLIWPGSFSGVAGGLRDWMLYAAENAIDIVESDAVKIYNLDLSKIEPASRSTQSLLLFFRLFLKLMVIGLIIKIASYFLFKKERSATGAEDEA